MAKTEIRRLTEAQFRQEIREGVINLLTEIANEEEIPAVYVGTYRKYNNGSLAGKWVALTDYKDYDELMAALRAIHQDENDPELMFQDWEYIPDAFISESHISERIYDFINERDDLDYDIKMAVANHCGDEDEYFKVIDDVIVYDGCNSMDDVAYEYIDMCGGIENATSNPENFFNYDAFGRDVRLEGDYDSNEYDSVYASWGLSDDASDEDLGEAIVNEVGWEGIGKDNLERYFDYRRFGRMLESEGTFIEYSGGYIQLP